MNNKVLLFVRFFFCVLFAFICLLTSSFLLEKGYRPDSEIWSVCAPLSWQSAGGGVFGQLVSWLIAQFCILVLLLLVE